MSIDRLNDPRARGVPPPDAADAEAAVDRRKQIDGSATARREDERRADEQGAQRADQAERWRAYSDREPEPVPQSVDQAAEEAKQLAQRQSDDRQEQERVKVSDILAELAIKNRHISG